MMIFEKEIFLFEGGWKVMVLSNGFFVMFVTRTSQSSIEMVESSRGQGVKV